MATVRHTGRPSPAQCGTVAMLTMTPSTTGYQYGSQVAGPFGQRCPKAAMPPLVGLGCGRLPMAGLLPSLKYARH